MIRDWLLTLRNAALALVVIAIGELLPPLQALERWMAPRRETLAWSVGGVAFAGWALLMGGILYRVFTGGGSLKREEIAAHIKSVKDAQGAPYAFRASRYKIPKKAWGAGFSDEMSIAQFKAAWQRQLWRGDPRWRGVFIMGFGAALMAIGGFGLPVVLGAPGLKLLTGGALLYAAVRVTWAFVKAR